MKNLLLFLIITCFITSINAQDIAKVKKEENKFIYGSAIKLFIGDKILVETKLDNNMLSDFKIVNAISDSSRTMIIEFTYEKLGGQKSSLLKVSNPFDKIVKYKAKMQLTGKNSYFETSVVPVHPKIYSMETWPYKIECIILTDFKLDN
jgi:hypothetical protein